MYDSVCLRKVGWCYVNSFQILCHRQHSSALPFDASSPNTQLSFPDIHQRRFTPVPRKPVPEPVSLQALLVLAIRSFSQAVSKGETMAGGGRNNAARGQEEQHCGPVRACGILLFTLTLVLCSSQYDPFK